MRIISDVTVVIKKKSFPGFIDELYKRGCDLLELQHIEEEGGGDLYTLRIGANNLRRFDEFITVIGGTGDRYRVIAVKNVIEDRIAGGLLTIAGKMPLENITDFNTTVLGASDLVREKIRTGAGARYTGIGRNVCLLAGISAAGDTDHGHLQLAYAEAERDAVVLNRFTGLNGFPLTVRYDHPEDVVTILKKIERNFAAVRIMSVDEATIMLYELLAADITVPIVSLEYDDIPLLLMTLLVKIMLKYRLKAEETTIGFIGIDLSAVRLTRVLDKTGFRRVLGSDPGEKAMLALENQGGLATTAENIFGNADVTFLMKKSFEREEFRKIRPGQFVISLIEDDDLDNETVSGKGVREFIRGDVAHVSALFPGTVRGVIDANIRSITDAKLVEISKKLVGYLSDGFEFPHLFGDIHQKVYEIITADGSKSKSD